MRESRVPPVPRIVRDRREGSGVYVPRTIDLLLDDLDGLRAVALEGARGIGKTSTASRRARSVIRLDDPDEALLFRASPTAIHRREPPVLLDEWQRVPSSWDVVRRAVDDQLGGPYLLTRSAAPERPPTHTGAGRIVRLHMRPMGLHERGLAAPAVSLGQLLAGDRPLVEGRTDITLEAYANEIVASGFPALRPLPAHRRTQQLDSYITSLAEHELPGQGFDVRRPETLRRWMEAYAAATATTSSFAKVRRAAEGDGGAMPAHTTTATYREHLERAWILEPLPGWLPTRNDMRRLVEAPKHHLVDPALAVSLLGLDVGALLEGRTGDLRDGPLTGRLFESLVTQAVRVMASLHGARIFHLRTKAGREEVDLIVQRRDRRVLAIEVKLSAPDDDHEVRHLAWLADQLGDDLLDAIVVTAGAYAYRRPDGIAVVPAALLGP